MGSEGPISGVEKLSVKDRLINNGVAQRVFNHLLAHNGTDNARFNFGIEDCDFTVRQVKVRDDLVLDDNGRPTERIDTDVVIEYPNPAFDPQKPLSLEKFTLPFVVKEGAPFGEPNVPLTPEQISEIHALLETSE